MHRNTQRFVKNKGCQAFEFVSKQIWDQLENMHFNKLPADADTSDPWP